MIIWFPIIIFVILLSLMGIFSLIDYKKKRILNKKYFISFIVPCYNSSKTIKETIESIYNSYDKEKFELFVINDNSTDNSLNIIRNSQKKYEFNVINNKTNLGKTKSINQIFDRTKGEILFILDSDTNLNKRAINDIIARFNNDPNLSAVSCPYAPKGRGFLPLMQTIEYNIINFAMYSHNIYSTISLLGCCLAVKRKDFIMVNKFSENSLSEDQDLALKLNEKNLRVEMSKYHVESNVPESFKLWYNQKIRWNGGCVQNFLTHPKAFMKNPVSVCIGVLYFIIVCVLLFNTNNIAYFYYNTFVTTLYMIKFAGFRIFSPLLYFEQSSGKFSPMFLIPLFSFVAFNIPYTFNLIKKIKDVKNILLAIPFCFIYYPIFLVTVAIGAYKGFNMFLKSKKIERAW